jgi:hypothetical protein
MVDAQPNCPTALAKVHAEANYESASKNVKSKPLAKRFNEQDDY